MVQHFLENILRNLYPYLKIPPECIYTHTHIHTYMQLLHQERTSIFLHTLLESADHQYFNGQHLACEVRTGMREVLTKSGLSFTYKIIQEILSTPRADSGYPHNFMVDFRVFKDDESKSDARTNSRHRVCLPLVGSPLLAHCVYTHTHTHTYF